MEQEVTFTQEEQKFFTTDNNYIEYFFEVGIRPDFFSDKTITPDLSPEKINSKLVPEIISKFPYFDKKTMTIDSSIIDFILPKGFKAIMSPNKPSEEFYTLILDNPFYNSDYSYKYIGCLVIYESLNIYKKLYDSSYSESDPTKDLTKSKDDFKNIYIPKCLCLASVHPKIKNYELILRAIYSLVLNGKNYFIDSIIEKLICQIPKIPRGIKNIFLKIDKEKINLTETKLNELSTVNVDLKIIFSNFKIEKIVEIFKLILFETKVIFFCSKINEITNYILCFMLLLKPFTYQYRILSTLPKKCYCFLEDNSPNIFGVNEIYNKNFFQVNNLIIGKEPICIVDLDKKDYYMINKSIKNFPTIPKHLKDKLDKRIEEYRKSKKKAGDKNEDYQEIFYRFMINLLKDYPKFLKKNAFESNKLQDIFDKQGYINSQSNSDKEFYDKITNSQMFLNLIIKRLMPRDTKEKIQALFLEEKINVKLAQKKIIGGNKILGQNILLPSKEFDYQKNPEIIDLTGDNPYTKLSNETINFFSKENINKEICFSKGYIVREGQTKSELYFEYYLFPELLSEELFKYNLVNYHIPSNFNLTINKICEEIIKNSYIKFDEISKNKNGEFLNDILISYVILFTLSLSYMDKEERKPRFNTLLQILYRIDEKDMELIELLFNSLIKLEEEELAMQLYTMFNQLHINLTWSIFSSMSKILHKGQGIYASVVKEMKSSRGSSLKLINRNIQNNIRISENKFRKRSIKLPGIDDNILGEEIFFDVFGVCLKCKNSINLEKICEELSPKDLDKNNNRFKCKCGDWNIQKLNFKIGTELYNKNITTNHSSLKDGIILYSPTNLKKKLLQISSLLNTEGLDIPNFRKNYPEVFWNSVWYFKLKEIDISFMLPYTTPVYLYKLRNETNLNNFANLIMEEEESCLNKMCNNEIKNPNIIIKKIKTKTIEYNNDNLFIQKVYQFAIIKIVGMITYKQSESYRGNIHIKGNAIKGVYSKKKITKKNEKNNKDINKDDYVLLSNPLITSDFDLTTSASTAHLDKSEEVNNKMKETYNIYENEINRKTKARFSNEELFEYIKEDDDNYYKFKDYKEDESFNA